MPASFQFPATSLPTKGETYGHEHDTVRAYKVMNKTIPFKGGDKVSDILTVFNKVVDNGKRSITLKLDFVSTLSYVAPQAQVSAEDKAAALAAISPTERAIIASFEAMCKDKAKARIEGKANVERWAISGTIVQL